MNTSDISHPHENYDKLFNKTFSLAKNNLLEIQAMTLKESISLMGYLVYLGGSDGLGMKELDKREQERMQELDELSKLDGVIKLERGIIKIDDSAFDNLIDAIDERIIDQIKNLEDYDKRCVLLIGGDDALIKGVVSFIYYVHTRKIFHYINCLGEDETEIIQKIFLGNDTGNGQTKEPVIERYKRGDTLFLRRPGKDVLYKLEKIIWHTDVVGMLILSEEKNEDVPDYFRDRITVINLEPEKQGETTSKKIPRGQKKPYADQNKFNEFLLEITKKYENCTLDKKANMAISQMEGRRLFLDDKGKPIYKKSTIKKMLSKLNKPKKTKGKS